jgi:ribosomal-protein-alanine N-acetyltransferase
MSYQFHAMSDQEAQAISQWHYEPPYDSYDLEQDPEDLAEFLSAEKRAERYFVVYDEQEHLIGFFVFTPGENGVLEIGLGLRPDLTGHGTGGHFITAGLEFAHDHLRPTTFALRVAAFNTRAKKIYERAGFIPRYTYEQQTNGGAYPFVYMTKAAIEKL